MTYGLWHPPNREHLHLVQPHANRMMPCLCAVCWAEATFAERETAGLPANPLNAQFWTVMGDPFYLKIVQEEHFRGTVPYPLYCSLSINTNNKKIKEHDDASCHIS